MQKLSIPLWGSSLWRVRLNIQHSFEEGYSSEGKDTLFLDFRDLKKGNRVATLWVSGSLGARVEHLGRILAADLDSAARCMEQFPKLVNKQLSKIDVTAPAGDTKFVFADDLVLNCFTTNSSDYDCWGIDWEDGTRLKLGPGPRLWYETALR